MGQFKFGLFKTTELYHHVDSLYHYIIQVAAKIKKSNFNRLEATKNFLPTTDDMDSLIKSPKRQKQSASYELLRWKKQDDDFRARKSVLRKGDFFQVLSFLGAVGLIKEGPGMEALLELAFADVLNIKRISKATRTHTLLYDVLYCHLGTKQFDFDLNDFCQYSCSPRNCFHQDHLDSHFFSEENGLNDAVRKTITDLLILIAQSFSNRNQFETASLWLYYLKMIEIFLQFNKSGDKAIWKNQWMMLPCFVASGYYENLKSLYLHFQKISEPELTKPALNAHVKRSYHVVHGSNWSWSGLLIIPVVEQVLICNLKTSGGLAQGCNITGQQKTTCFLSTISTTEVSMQELTYFTFQNRDQTSRIKSLTCSKERDYFLIDYTVNLATADIGDNNLNIHDTQELGVPGFALFDFTYEKEESKKIHMDSTLLFERLTAACSPEELSTAFGYELSPQPTSLFDKDGLMNKADKRKLKAALRRIVGQCSDEIPNNAQYIVDGGYLLYKVPWSVRQPIQQITESFKSYIKARYGEHHTVVFDGGYLQASTKDTVHIRRAKQRVGKNLQPNLNSNFTINRREFLLNYKNKHAFLLSLGSALEKSGVNIIHADGDADLLIVKTALEKAKHHPTVIVGEDIDLLILALHYFSDHKELFVTYETKGNNRTVEVWNIAKAKCILNNICNGLLVIHAISGCDNTSRVSNIGKVSVLHKYKQSKKFQRLAAVFLNEFSNKEDIVDAGEKLMLEISGASKGEESMDDFRFLNYNRIKKSKSPVKLQLLGPTSDATAQHSLRVYHQVQAWKGRDLVPFEWGWTLNSGKVMPVKMTLPPVPPELLKVIRCSCETECKDNCTCVQYKLKCSALCTRCRGHLCQNYDRPT